MAIPTFVDAAGILRSVRDTDGPLDMNASAYDTCLLLGSDPLYAGDTMLPDKVRDFYEPWGDEVLEHAVLGWRRGRGYTMRDPWQKSVKHDPRPRAVRVKKTDTTELFTPVPVNERSGARKSSTGPKGPSVPNVTARTVQRVDTDTWKRTVITAAVIRDVLPKDLKALMREHLRPEHWQPQGEGKGKTCRTVGEVFRTCEVYSRQSVSTGPHREIQDHLRRLFQWQATTYVPDSAL